jgi:hypothetical protein
MKCPACGSTGTIEDNFCRNCGTSRNSRLPVKRAPAQPPAIWRQAAPVVARGAALIAVGVIGEWLLRAATRKAASMPFESRKADRKTKALTRQKQTEALPEGAIAMSETVIMRRTIIRR